MSRIGFARVWYVSLVALLLVVVMCNCETAQAQQPGPIDVILSPQWKVPLGTEAQIPVMYLCDSIGFEVGGFEFLIKYDTTGLEFNGAFASDTLLSFGGSISITNLSSLAWFGWWGLPILRKCRESPVLTWKGRYMSRSPGSLSPSPVIPQSAGRSVRILLGRLRGQCIFQPQRRYLVRLRCGSHLG